MPTQYGQKEQTEEDPYGQKIMEMINPGYRFQMETRERLTRYNIMDLHNVCNDFYSLKRVRIPVELYEINPIYKKALEFYQDRNTNLTEEYLRNMEVQE